MTASVLRFARRRGRTPSFFNRIDRFTRCLQCQRACFGVVRDGLRVFHIGIRLLEQASEELQPQHATGGLVDLGLGHEALLERLRQQCKGFAVRQIGIDTSLQCAHRCAQRIGRGLVNVDELLDREVVADHRAFELHFAAQDVLQQPAVHMRGHAIDFVV